MSLNQVYSYLMYLCVGLGMLSIFTAIYVHMTPIKEFRLVREGCMAAALSLFGAIMGFSLTVAASILQANTVLMVIVWSACAAVVQLLVYFVLSRLIPEASTAIEENNMAIGTLFGGAALIVGVVNAACLS